MRRHTAFVFAMTTVAASAQAQTAPAPGEAMYQRARIAWDRGEFGASEPLYKEALNLGGLAPDQTLDAYVHLGSARSIMGRKEGALAAFREAALIDPKFAVPSEAGKRTVNLAMVAKKDDAKIGAIVLRVEAPESAPAGQPIRVEAQLDATHAAIVPRLALLARDVASDAAHKRSEPSATSVVFEIPATFTATKGPIILRVAALDAHENRLMSVERRVTIESAKVEPAPAAVSEAPPPKKEKAQTAEQAKGNGFWSTPWPYAIGGLALVAVGGAIFLGTRSSDDVTVGAPRLAVQ